jgi:hypothetical protein
MSQAPVDHTLNDNQCFRMNFLDESYVSFEGPMGSMPIVYAMRFGTRVDPLHLKQVLRELVSANPRMRSVAEPGWHTYHLRVLPDNAIVDALFEQAWVVDTSASASDASAMEALHTRLHNLCVPIERGLLCRFVFVPDEHAPVFFLYAHHIVGDGATGQHLVAEMMKRLNGGPPMVFQPMEDPPLWQGFGPERLLDWPRAIWRSMKHERQVAQTVAAQQVVRLEAARSAYMSTHGLRYFDVPVAASRLREVARQWKVSLNTLVVLAVSEAFLSLDKDNPQAAAVIRQAMNVRKLYPASRGYGPLWGNHVGVFLIVETQGKTLQARAQSIKQQIDESARRYSAKEGFGRYAFTEIVPWVGRTVLGRIITSMVRQRKLPELSCYISNVGSTNDANPPGAAIVLTEFRISVPSPNLIQVVTELNDVLRMPACWERSEIDHDKMGDYLQRLNDAFVKIAAAA